MTASSLASLQIPFRTLSVALFAYIAAVDHRWTVDGPIALLRRLARVDFPPFGFPNGFAKSGRGITCRAARGRRMLLRLFFAADLPWVPPAAWDACAISKRHLRLQANARRRHLQLSTRLCARFRLLPDICAEADADADVDVSRRSRLRYAATRCERPRRCQQRRDMAQPICASGPKRTAWSSEARTPPKPSLAQAE